MVIPNSLPAPWVRSAIPHTTKLKIINGITNFRNREKIEDTVTKIRTKNSGNVNPMMAPTTIPEIPEALTPIAVAAAQTL